MSWSNERQQKIWRIQAKFWRTVVELRDEKGRAYEPSEISKASK